ncbi:hypothetical protein PR202_ga23532 [Eleusine coracana subsp. coracana]|uniref:Mandelate racemase/muconate lactonizing enzyme C-terminal domain-containing protein n=1 Tax=Eleusine coracana subsp. coracana TaxID=191504 RepID=A0AAV5D4G7_ELECO|nr:hypothetical protein PR202_ga23532 [Eleusine coracana subsp. coracana]
MDASVSSALRLSSNPTIPGRSGTRRPPNLVATSRHPSGAAAARLHAVSPSPSSSPPAAAPVESFGFDALKETFSVDVAAAEARPLDVPLAAPFTIASSRLESVSNVAVRVELRSGAVGWGEAPVLPSVTAEDQPAALAAAGRACKALAGVPTAPLGALLQEVAGVLPGHDFASIPIVAPNEAAQLAAKYRGQGFQTLKLKVGKNLNSDIEVLKAIRLVHPDCSFILDANEGYTAEQAIEVLDRLNEMGVTPVLFEQPVHRDDWEGLRDVSVVAMDKYKVAVAADESLEVIDAARKANVALMIGGMVETRIAMGFAGHLAAGLGCFSFIDLDTPLLLSEDPVYGGYEGLFVVKKE